MDFDNETVEETINAPVAVRAIAYDQNFDAFWANNYDTDFTLFDKDGVILNSFAVGSYGTFYGLAWDDQEYDGTPCLYGHSQDNNATIVQFDIATGSETGVTYNSGAFGTQNAGGLAICDGIVPGYRTMLGILQNDVIFGLEFGEDNGSMSYIVPENLLGFNLYKNTEFLDYIEYVEEQNEFEYWDYDVEPGCHEYEVTALYDLYPYGIPEDTAESGSEGPAIICGGAAFPMPFYEDWESGSFENHEWSASSENWIVNHEIGNPGKSAEFKGLPELHNYELELESFFIYTWDIVDGTMYFDFDIKLVDIEENASEKFIPGIYTNQEFHPMDTLYNSGTTEWLSKHYDVTDLFKDGHINNSHYFRLVFKVEGENSSNIDSWFIDNIYVYHLCEEPQNLSLEPQFGYEYSIAKLNWEPPFAPYHWLYYHDNTFENSLSSIEPGLGFAQLFIPEDHPATIQKAKLFIGDHLNYQNYIDVYLLSGDGNTILAGPITVQAVEENSWITINFGEVSIGEGHFLIYVQNLQENGPFLAVDDELENPNLYYGNPGNFTALNQWGYHFVSSCQAYITYNQTGNIVNNSNVLQPVSKNFRPKISLSNQQYMPEKAANQRALTGYNIWRNNELIQTNWPETYYNDTIYEAGEYSYFISALYDQCESDTTGTVHISFFAAVNSYTESNQIIIYPNPVQEQLNIILNSQEDVIHHFTLTSVSGQPVVSLSPVSRRIRLSISRLPEGLYIAEIRTGNKREFRKIIIN